MRTLIKTAWGAKMVGTNEKGQRVQMGACVGLDVPAFYGFSTQQKRRWRKHGVVAL